MASLSRSLLHFTQSYQWVKLHWTELNWSELNWMYWTELNWTELNWRGRPTIHFRQFCSRFSFFFHFHCYTYFFSILIFFLGLCYRLTFPRQVKWICLLSLEKFWSALAVNPKRQSKGKQSKVVYPSQEVYIKLVNISHSYAHK